MKILFVIDAYFVNNNGTSISAQRFADELRQRGHEVRVLTACDEPRENIYSMPELKIPFFQGIIRKHGFQYAQWRKKIIHEAVDWADIIHCYFPFVLEAKAKKMADKLGKPATAAFHVQPQNITSSLGTGKSKWVNEMVFKLFRNTTYNHYGHVHTPSQFMADEIASRGYTAKIHPISNGIQSDFKWTKCPKSPEFEGKYLIMMVGRLFAQDPVLYADIILSNKRNLDIIERYADEITRSIELLKNGDRDAFIEQFRMTKDFFGPLATYFLSESKDLIAKMHDAKV